MMRVGMTGGIACGKSVAARRFAERGAPVMDADDVALELTAPDSALLDSIAARAGQEVLQPDGHLDRPLLRAMIFTDAALRRDLEALLHPAVRTALHDWFANKTTPYAIAVVPLLVEAGWQNDFDRILVVNCPAALQRERLRGHLPKMDNSQAEAILHAQLSAAERLQHADDVIENAGGFAELNQAVDALHRKYSRHD